MPITSDIILDWIHADGYSLSETGWIRAQDHEYYFETRLMVLNLYATMLCSAFN